MSYRRITVKGKTYEYVVGKTHVKIKGVGTWPKEVVGDMVPVMCELCRDYNCRDSSEVLAVQPAHIRRMIVECAQ